VGIPRNTTVTKPGRWVKAVIMRSAISRGSPEKKAANGGSRVAFISALICKGLVIWGVHSK
jgi:hypothetical protein